MVDETPAVRPMHPTVDARRRAAQRPEAHRRRQRFAIAIVGALVLAVVGIIATGYVIFFVFPPRQLAVRVNDVSYTRGDVVKLLRWRQAIVQRQFNPGEDVGQALQLIVENEIIAQAAPRLGISVTRRQVDDRVRSTIMTPGEFNSLGKDGVQIEREFRERYRGYLNLTQLSESDHRELVRRSILRAELRQYLGDLVPALAVQVHLHRIVMSSADEVEIMQIKLEDAIGDDKRPESIQKVFKAISREFSRDPQTIQSGGDLGWVPLGIYKDYQRRFFDLEAGELSPPVPNLNDPSQLYFFMVSERSGMRALDPANVDILETGALQGWLNEERADYDIFTENDSSSYDWITEQLRLTSRVAPAPATGPAIPGL